MIKTLAVKGWAGKPPSAYAVIGWVNAPPPLRSKDNAKRITD